ncbi:MAG: glycosyltransferase family 39 protein [Chloroflexi bacterium]|nr:glycosyltransferase family 39 protein [Chloroflexota bacterium]
MTSEPAACHWSRSMTLGAIGFALLAGLLFLWLVTRQLERPLMYDDANFALAAQAIAHTGVPFGNQGWMSDRGDYSEREQWALWHPPLYIYLLGAAAHLPLPTLSAFRLPGMLGGIATGVLTFLLAAQLTRGDRPTRSLAGGLAVLATLLAPVVVQSALILDIDFPLLLPLTLLFLLLYLRLEATGRWPWLALLLGVMLWSKMTNPLPLLAAIVGWQILRWQPRRALIHGLGIGGGAILLFAVSWWAIGTHLGFPLDMPFAVNLVQWQDSADVAHRAYTDVGAFLAGLQPTVLWLGPGLVALGLSGCALRVGALVERWRIRGVDLLILLLGAFVLGYVNKTAGWFPKYEVAFAPLLACIGAPLAAVALRRAPVTGLVLGVVACLVAGWATYQLVGDGWALQRTWALDASQTTWLLGLALIGLAVGLLRRVPALAVLGLVAIALGWGVGLDLYQLDQPYSTGYWYGTEGTDAASAWVSTHIAPDQTYAAAKELAWQSPAQRYLDQDTLLAELQSGAISSPSWQDQPLVAVVAWQREPYVADQLRSRLLPLGFRVTHRFGDYVVYEPRG